MNKDSYMSYTRLGSAVGSGHADVGTMSTTAVLRLKKKNIYFGTESDPVFAPGRGTAPRKLGFSDVGLLFMLHRTYDQSLNA